MASLRRDFGPVDLKPELERAGVQGSIAVQARQSLEETRWLLKLAASSPLIFGVVGWVDLRSADFAVAIAGVCWKSKIGRIAACGAGRA
jgi:L-fuconolactonase